MYYRTLESITDERLKKSALLCKEKGYNLRSIYVDPQKECAIIYYGHLDESQVKEIIKIYSSKDIDPVYFLDYEYVEQDGQENTNIFP